MSGGIPDQGDGHSPDFWNPDLGPHGFRDGQSESGLFLPDDPLPFPHEPFPPTLIIDLHKNSDVDSSNLAQHHTVGPRHNQASPGDHSHDGKTSAILPQITTLQNQVATLQNTSLVAGQIINKSASVSTASGTMTTTTAVDLIGATFTITNTHANAKCNVWATFDITIVTGAAGITALGILNVDGTDQTAQAIFDNATSGSRATISQCWQLTLAAGTHTLKLRGQNVFGVGGISFSATHTTITATCYDM